MSSPPSPAEVRRIRNRLLDLYAAITLLMLLGIAVLIVYSVLLGPLTSPGAQQSFGYALALMFLMAGVVFHLVDKTYRSWPLGRRFRPTWPGYVTVESEIRFFKILTVVAAGAAIAYVLGGLIA
ncbi:MAG TPA: hypothetical protein VMH38_05605 [Thermoplasmata archaeon]|nr:hypothetical protein [Thermoplasmata archaeon]